MNYTILGALLCICLSSYSQQDTWSSPVFHTDEEGLFYFLSENVRYPNEARENCIMGQVYVTFIVKTSGEIDSLNVQHSVHRSLDQEAMRVIKLTNGLWIPGKVNDEIVDVKYTVPVKFTLKSSGCKETIYFYNEGIKFAENKKYEKALTNFKIAVRRDSHDVKSLLKCAEMKINLNDIPGACEYLQRIKLLEKSEADELLAKHCN